MSKRKVLFLITKSNWGGAQKYVFDLATALPKDRFEAVVALGGTGAQGAKEGLLAKKLADASIRTIFISSFMRDISLSKELASFGEIWNLLKQEKPDVMHLNSSKAAGVGALAGRMYGIKNIIFTAHGWPYRETRNPLAKILIWLFSWLTALLSHKVICVSDYDLAEARAMPGISKKAVRIYNGLDTKFSSELLPGDYVRDRFPPGVHIIGTIGELNNNKNQIELIERANRDPNMYVAICGAGENRLFLQKKIDEYKLNNRVILFGFVEPRMVLKGFDTFALPSLKEGLPYVLLEARAAGLPIVANRVGGVSEAMDKPLSEFSKEKMVERTFALYN